MLKDLRKKGDTGFASIVEVAVTAVIFVLATAGILSTISMLRPHAQGSSKKIGATYTGKGIIDDLRKYIDATTWYNATSPLAVGTTSSFVNGIYTIDYTVQAVAGNPDLRRLVMNITWPD